MNPLTRIVNSLTPTPKETIVNAAGADKGVGTVPVIDGSNPSSTTLNEQSERKLEDLQLIKRNIQNCRLAMELDPTTWSSIISLVIVASKDFDIVGDDEADENAIQHIKAKAKEWDLKNSLLATRYKGLVDGRCFIEKYIKPGTSTIASATHQAYDSQWYDFLELRDPYTNIVQGYMQKARIYPLPSNWEATDFNQLKNRQYVDRQIPFQPDQVFMPRFLYGDGNSEGLVYKALDDVYNLKELKNMVPPSVKMAASTLGVQVGTKDMPFKPYNQADTYEEKEAKVQSKMSRFADDFNEKWKKEVVVYSGGITPTVIGQGQLVDFTNQMEFFKQEIRAALLTPDSKFESSKGSRFTAQEQMSGSMGQSTVIDFINYNYCSQYYEKSLIDHELKLSNYPDSMGHVWIEYQDDNQEDESLLKDIGQTLFTIRPELFTPENDIGLQAYFPKIIPYLQAQKKGQTKLTDFQKQENQTTVTNTLGNGIPDIDNPVPFLESAKTLLEERGILI